MLKRIKTGAEPGLSKTSAGSKLGSGLTLKNTMTWLQHFLLVSISSLNSIDSIDAIAFVWKKASQVKSLVLSTERMTSAQILPQLNPSINKLIIVFHMWLNESIMSAMYDDVETIEAIRITDHPLVSAHHFRCYSVCQLSQSLAVCVYWLSGGSDCGSCTAGSSLSSATVGKWNWIKGLQKKPPNSTAISPAGFPISVEWIDSSWLSTMIHVMCEHLKFKGFQHSLDSIEVGAPVEDNQVRRILGHTGHHQPQVVVNLHMARPAIRLQHGWWFSTIFGIATHLAKPIDYWVLKTTWTEATLWSHLNVIVVELVQQLLQIGLQTQFRFLNQ